MDAEIQNFTKVWISALASLTYCYYISLNIPNGKFRFLSFLPVFYFLTTLPLNLTTISLGGSSAFFLTWLANFKLALFSFGQGPLCSNQSISLSGFISVACLPIRITNTDDPFSQSPKKSSPTLKKPLKSKTKKNICLQNAKSAYLDLKNSQTTKTGEAPLPKIPTKAPKSPLILAAKCLILALLTIVYERIQLHPNIMFPYYCCYMYLVLEVMATGVAGTAADLLRVELEPQFNEPYLSTSLQDFWGRRWNLTVTNILRPTVYEPMRSLSTKALGIKCASLLAVLATFLVSWLMHELIFYYLGRAKPTWEVTCFFILQGICLVVEIVAKKALKGSFELHWVVSMPLTVGFVMVTATGYWLFFPQLMRCKTDVRSSREIMALLNFVKNLQSVYDWGSTFLERKIFLRDLIEQN